MPAYHAKLRMNGINRDINPVDLPPTVWTEAGNMVSRPKGMERAAGYAEIFPTPLFAPYFLLYTPQLGTSYWLYAGTNNIAVIDDLAVHTDVTPAELNNTVQTEGWTGGNLNGIAVINSIENDPFYWFQGIGATAEVLPGLRPDTRYRVMRPFKYHLVGLGVTDGGGDFRDAVHWSHAADPGQVPATWVPAPDNEAGDNVLSDENGEIIDGLALRDSFYIYKQDSVYEMSYAGGSAVMRFRKVFGTVGVLARNCIVRVKGSHVVLGNGDIYQHDGQNIQSLCEGRVKRDFFALIDNVNYRNSFAAYLEAREEVWFCVPETGQTAPSAALVWNVVTNEWGIRSLPQVDYAAAGIIEDPTESQAWDDDAQPWNEDVTLWSQTTLSSTDDALLLADATAGKLYKADVGVTRDGEPYHSQLSRLGLDLGEPNRLKAIRRIWPRITAPNGIPFTLQLYGQTDLYADVEVLGAYPFLTGEKNGVAVNENTRYLGLQIKTEESINWDCSGADVDFDIRGKF